MTEPDEPQDPLPVKGWRARVRFWAEILHKLAIPLLTVFGTMLTLVINERNNTRATLNQREQAESELRSNMFSELVNPLIEQSRLGESPSAAAPAAPAGAAAGTTAVDPALAARADRLTLLGELLALNFHEHFELGPLLRYVERMEGQSADNRHTLRSVARRVSGRQIAMLGRPETRLCATAGEGTLNFERLDLVTEAGQPASGLSCFLYRVEGDATDKPRLECSSRQGPDPARKWQPLKVVSPDCRDELIITLRNLDWDRQTLEVYLLVASKEQRAGTGAAQTETLDFSLSPYSLPFSDNTLLSSGNRFGLYVRSVSPDSNDCAEPGCVSSPRTMSLHFLWFPEDFYPPRERPTDFTRVRKALDIRH